jgi:hypothetical protein
MSILLRSKSPRKDKETPVPARKAKKLRMSMLLRSKSLLKKQTHTHFKIIPFGVAFWSGMGINQNGYTIIIKALCLYNLIPHKTRSLSQNQPPYFKSREIFAVCKDEVA